MKLNVHMAEVAEGTSAPELGIQETITVTPDKLGKLMSEFKYTMASYYREAAEIAAIKKRESGSVLNPEVDRDAIEKLDTEVEVYKKVLSILGVSKEAIRLNEYAARDEGEDRSIDLDKLYHGDVSEEPEE
jgi:hypothetical protein